VRAAQRERLITAAIAAVAETGFHGVTVADVVRRAKVSRAAFYVHFPDKEDCFLAATRHGGRKLFGAVVEASRALPPDAPSEDLLRAGCRAFLRFLADEPAFARVFYVDMPAATAGTVVRLDASRHRYASINQEWHERARRRHPEWPEVPYDAYLALAGATTELISVRVRDGRTADLPELEDTLVALHLAVLAGRPWPSSPAPATGVPQDRSMVDESSGAP
jgi:AcrR family transcriptional regulator